MLPFSYGSLDLELIAGHSALALQLDLSSALGRGGQRISTSMLSGKSHFLINKRKESGVSFLYQND